MNQNKIAIIGGTGFIGSKLTQCFVENSYIPLVIGRYLENLTELHGKFHFETIDIIDTKRLINRIEEYNIVIWLVDNLIPNSKFTSTSEVFSKNTLPIINFLEGIEKKNQKIHFIYFSSGGVIYGDPEKRSPISEHHSKNPKSVYGLSKLLSEQYIQFIVSKSQNISSTIIRPSNVYGLGQNLHKAQGIIGYGFNAILNNNTLDLFGGGNVIRDFIHVDDLVEAIWLILKNLVKMTNKIEIFNVGSNHGYSIVEVLKMMELISGKTLNTNCLPSRSIDCNYNVLNCSKIENKIGWKPQILLFEGLQSIWQYQNKDYSE